MNDFMIFAFMCICGVDCREQLDAHGVVRELDAYLHESVWTHFVLDHEPSGHSVSRSDLIRGSRSMAQRQTLTH